MGFDLLAAQLPAGARGIREELPGDDRVSPEREGGDGQGDEVQRPDDTQEFNVSGEFGPEADEEPRDEEPRDEGVRDEEPEEEQPHDEEPEEDLSDQEPDEDNLEEAD